MVAPAAGQVVLVPFPLSDLSQSKVRPAVCLADAGRGDWVLCQVTSSPYSGPAAVAADYSGLCVGRVGGGEFRAAGQAVHCPCGFIGSVGGGGADACCFRRGAIGSGRDVPTTG